MAKSRSKVLQKSMLVENVNTGNVSLTFNDYDGFLTGDYTSVEVFEPGMKKYITTLSSDRVIGTAQPRDGFLLVKYL